MCFLVVGFSSLTKHFFSSSSMNLTSHTSLHPLVFSGISMVLLSLLFVTMYSDTLTQNSVLKVNHFISCAQKLRK